MKRAILFRFHKKLNICENRLQLIKKYNPKVPIFGLYGNDKKDFRKVKKKLSKYFVSLIYSNKKPRWQRFGSDLLINYWYKKEGKKYKWDMLHVVEWDMLIFDSIDKIFKKVKDGVGLSGVRKIKTVAKIWNWIKRENPRKEYEKLLEHVKEKYNYSDEPVGCIFPGASLSRKFLQKYSKLKIPELCHDEIRVPLFAQILGFKIHDTDFYGKWLVPSSERLFNSRKKEIKLKIIKEELKKPKGRRIFHPYYKVYKFD